MDRVWALDIETYLKNRQVSIYCIGYACGVETKLIAYDDSNDVFLKFLKSLICSTYTFYIHNLTFYTSALLENIELYCTDVSWYSKNYTVY